MATTITVTNSTEMAAARSVAEHFRDYDPDFNGDALRVERGEFLCIDGCDEIAGARLLAAVHREIDRRESRT